MAGEDFEAFDVRIPMTTRGLVEAVAIANSSANRVPNGVASPTGFEPVF